MHALQKMWPHLNDDSSFIVSMHIVQVNPPSSSVLVWFDYLMHLQFFPVLDFDRMNLPQILSNQLQGKKKISNHCLLTHAKSA